ncbi:MAG: ribosome maturation factor RimM [Burkholderiales bacterium]|nr:ribosome maturation factor RimM [Burkholderiales bacterium]
MGRIAAPYGIKGWVKIQSFTEAADSLLDFPVWWLGREGEWREAHVIEAFLHGKTIVANIDASPDRNVAERLKGLQIAVPRSSLPAAGENEYYWSDLIGLKVVNLDGVELGSVGDIIETGANDVLEVKGESTHLIPFVGKVVLDVDLENSVIRVDWGADY